MADIVIIDDEPVESSKNATYHMEVESDLFILDDTGVAQRYNDIKSKVRTPDEPLSVTQIAQLMIPPTYEKLWSSSLDEFRDIDSVMEENGISAFLPIDRRDIFRAFFYTPLYSIPAEKSLLGVDQRGVKVCILGEGPFPNPNHAIGLSFSVPAEVQPLPPASKNIMEMIKRTVVNCRERKNGDLTYLALQGVLLLNMTLTLATGKEKKYNGSSWVGFHSRLFSAIQEVNPTCIFVLWGTPARKFKDSIIKRIPRAQIVEASHPSSACYGGNMSWFEHNNFNEVNALLKAQNKTPIMW